MLFRSLGLARYPQGHGVLFIAPVDCDEGGEGRFRTWSRSGHRGRTFIGVIVGCVHTHTTCQLVAKPARWLGFGEVLVGETSTVDILSIRFEPKRRAGSESLSQDVATYGSGNSSSQPGVTVEPLAPKSSLFTGVIARAAKLFTVGCGERSQGLSSPPVNNFGEAIRARGYGGERTGGGNQ